MSTGGSAEPDGRERFIGSWELVSYEVRLVSGILLKPFGDHPTGRILYQKGGQMSAQLMLPDVAAFEDADPLQATTEEADAAWRNYIGYWGSFDVNAKEGILITTLKVHGSQTGSDRTKSAPFTSATAI